MRSGLKIVSCKKTKPPLQKGGSRNEGFKMGIVEAALTNGKRIARQLVTECPLRKAGTFGFKKDTISITIPSRWPQTVKSLHRQSGYGLLFVAFVLLS